jgi:hypothetical protein
MSPYSTQFDEDLRGGVLKNGVYGPYSGLNRTRNLRSDDKEPGQNLASRSYQTRADATEPA